MREKFDFQIRPLSLEEGFEVVCDGIVEHPNRVKRLFRAVVLATQLGKHLNFQIQILDVDGQKAGVIERNRDLVLAD
ncbi:MAG: hypothetical protein QOE70_3818 [Chthoniobacter sp.]|jgi:hypothetical protein|nr:hypothetical protein [Chthoniobacter sp.]